MAWWHLKYTDPLCMASLPIENRIALILSTIIALVHYGAASNDNSSTALKENESWCGGKRIIHKSQGQLDVDLSILLNSSITTTDPPFECNFKIRANTPISFQWFKFSRNFTGKYGDCNQTNNIVKVWTGYVYCDCQQFVFLRSRRKNLLYFK